MPHLDHMIPLDAGGPHSLENLAYAHAQCNLMKGPRTPDQHYDRLIQAVTYMFV